MQILNALFFLMAMSPSAQSAGPEKIRIENAAFALNIDTEGSTVYNKMSEKSLPLKDPDFALDVISAAAPPGPGEEGKPIFLAQISPGPNRAIHLGPESFRLKNVETHAETRSVSLRFVSDDYPLEIEEVYETPENAPVLYKHLRWRLRTGYAARPWFVESVQLLNTSIPKDQIQTPGGFGQLVFLRDGFVGIEYPDAEARYENGSLRASEDIYQTVAEEWQESDRLVIGASTRGQAATAFSHYLDGLRPHANNPYILYNTWYDLRDQNEAEILKRVHFFTEELSKKHHIDLDAFVLDDGWDNESEKLWETSDKRFPKGFASITDAFQGSDAGLGLWLSPWGGYDEGQVRRSKQASSQNLETMDPFLCLGGERYWRYLNERIEQIQSQAHVAFWKLDGILSTCNRADHGHPIGRASRPLLVKRFIELAKKIHQISPKTRIDMTVGSWPSPWWLKWADFLWMGGLDYSFAKSAASPSRREDALTYRDSVLYQKIVKEGNLVPLNSLMTHGVIRGRLNPIDAPNDPSDAWAKDVVMFFSRGVALWELYLSQEEVSDAQWETLSKAMAWAKSHWNLLKETQWLGGDPSVGELYGYGHISDSQAILTLRNPSPKKQLFTMKTPFHYKRTFPAAQALVTANGRLRIELKPWEVVVLTAGIDDGPSL